MPDAAWYLDVLARENAAFHDAMAHGLTEPVPSCPGWTQADLSYHLGEVQHFWAWIAEHRPAGPDDYEEPARPDDEDLPAWGRDRSEALVAVLRTADPADAAWSWSPQHDVAFIQRRMAQEAVIHRWDAESVHGATPGPIAPEVGVDGIAEFLSFHLNTEAATAADAPVGGTVHLHATDGVGEWFVQPSADGFSVEEGHKKGDVALRGPAGDLLLALWRRIPVGRLDVVGDGDVGARFLAASDLE